MRSGLVLHRGRGWERSETGEGLVTAQILFLRGIPEPRDGRGGGGFPPVFPLQYQAGWQTVEDLD